MKFFKFYSKVLLPLRVVGWGLRVGIADRVNLWWKSWRLGLEWDLGVNLKVRSGVNLGTGWGLIGRLSVEGWEG